ncbi:MAG: 30S ribosomal protein S2 [Planctomycetes bacterium]|nr:30S ribosomal protein S2 [Planctomycetota bacterium]
MYGVPIKTLLECGVHFGHRASRWNPKMEPYIHGKRNLIHIIDLKETLRGLIKACAFLQGLSAEGHQILFVGTKRQAQTLVQQVADNVNMPYVAERWLGGTLTNNETVRSRLRRLDELEALEGADGYAGLSKREISRLLREKRKISRNLHGIRNMKGLPGAMIIVDPRKEKTAVKEARRMGVPTVAILDTDCDPGLIDIPIPGNDDALRSLQVLMAKLGEAISNGRQAHVQFLAEEQKRRADDDAKKDEGRKHKLEQNKKKAAEQVELEKILKKARDERTRRMSEAEGAQARAEAGEPESEAKPEAAAPVEGATGETKPGPNGPEPVEG